MPARDAFHDAVRHALEKDGWTITHDPFPIRAEFGQMYIDLGAEKVLAAEREGQKIALKLIVYNSRQETISQWIS